jgi:excisionase family DNA binding protein
MQDLKIVPESSGSELPFAHRVTCTIAQACAATGLGRTKVYQAIADGRLQSVKIDNRRLVKVSSLIKWLGL